MVSIARGCFRLLIAAGLLAFSLAGPADHRPAQQAPAGSAVRFGLSPTLLEGDVNNDDALAATKVWAQTIGRAAGMWQDSEARIFPDLGTLVSAVRRRESDIVALCTYEYIEVQPTLGAEACLTYQRAGRYDVEYQLLVRADSGIKSLSELPGKRIDFLVRKGVNSLAHMWFEVLLQDAGVGAEQRSLIQRREVQKSSQAILAAFFKQVDAAVVPRSSFEIASALNPQVGQQLKALASSQKFVPWVVCMSNSLAPDLRQKYIETALRLHETLNGLQTFNIFKTERLVRWEPWFANDVRDLMRRYKSLGGPGVTAAVSRPVGQTDK